jgi:UDP-N-acetylglucosamine--N-acetylmuramyl-(pentapeptide) pyrophosphoryl-undecaprenol N-acetylglucosamine transferase
LRLLQSLWEALRILRRRGADAVLGMGGYVCLPGGLMARLLGKPLMLVNADASLLLSNKALLRLADRIAFGFEGGAASGVRGAVVTGNPVRPEIEALSPPTERFTGRGGPLRLLVVGGSLGARVLNQTMPLALALLDPAKRPVVTHQTGTAHLADVQAAYAAAGVQAELLPFIDDMPARLAECDVVVCRAGAITVSELCAAGVASVLVPLVVSTTSHQRDNAEWMALHKAAIHLPQQALTPQGLASTIASLHRAGLLAMAIHARNLARPHAAQRVADEIEHMVRAA